MFYRFPLSLEMFPFYDQNAQQTVCILIYKTTNIAPKEVGISVPNILAVKVRFHFGTTGFLVLM